MKERRQFLVRTIQRRVRIEHLRCLRVPAIARSDQADIDSSRRFTRRRCLDLHPDFSIGACVERTLHKRWRQQGGTMSRHYSARKFGDQYVLVPLGDDHELKRFLWIAGGGLLSLMGVSRGRLTGTALLLLGGGLIFRGVSGYSPLCWPSASVRAVATCMKLLHIHATGNARGKRLPTKSRRPRWNRSPPATPQAESDINHRRNEWSPLSLLPVSGAGANPAFLDPTARFVAAVRHLMHCISAVLGAVIQTLR